jgi:hypothetical protein
VAGVFYTIRVLFENRVLRRIFGPKRAEVMAGWTKLHNEELHDLYFLQSIIRMIKSMKIRWVGHVARMGEKRNMYRLLVGKQEGKESTRKTRCRWVDNIKMGLVEIGWDAVDWLGLAQDREKFGALMNVVMNLQVPLLSGYTSGGLSSSGELHRIR